MRKVLSAVLLLLCSTCFAADPVVGWRGNWTGRFPDATPPITWERRSKSPLSDIRTSARKPKGEETTGALVPHSQSIVSWLVLGPFAADDAKKALDQEYVPNEAALAPDDGDKVGE